MSFFIQRADGTQLQVRGYRRLSSHNNMPRYHGNDSRDWDLPARVDLRRHMTPIEDQAQTNSCVANAVAGAYEYLVARHLGDDAYDVSRLFIYYNGRTMDGSEDEDQGTFIHQAIEGLVEYGACSEETWPFEPELVNEEPSEEAYQEAAEFCIEAFSRIPNDLDLWRECLAEGYPIVFGLQLFNSFDRHRQPGLVPMPTRREQQRGEHGGHAMLCVGYSDRDQVFIVRNSWGSDWGDDGYCYIPYRYMMNNTHNDGDSWTFRRIEVVELDEDLWDDEGELFEDAGGVLASMSEDDYEALMDACGRVPVEARLGILMLITAGMDGRYDENELATIESQMNNLLDALGVNASADQVLNFANNVLSQHPPILAETVDLFAQHLDRATLAAFLDELITVADADGEEDEQEANFIDSLVERWQLQDEMEDGDDEDDDWEDEGEDEDWEEDEEDGDWDEGGDGDEGDEDWDDEDDW